jgi:hypothetical protein
MKLRREGAYRVCVDPSDTVYGHYVWVIRSPDGRCLARSPYAFATKAAARLARECFKPAVLGQRWPV